MVTQRMGAQASALLKDVLAYLEWLLHEERLEITLHRLEPCLQACLDSLLPYNIHTNALCLYAKQSLAVWKQCIDCQVKVRARAEQGPYFGICWVGVSEFVVPIKTLSGDVIGFVCVSGYASDRARSLRRIERVAGQYNLHACEMTRILDQQMRWDIPPAQEVYARVQPLAHMLTLLIHALDVPRKGPDASSTDQLYARVIQHLDRYYQLPITLEQLSDQFNCSPSYMSRLFNRCCGCSLKQYVNGRRIRTARTFLESSSMSVQEIAYTVGYSDPNYFATVFRQLCGMSPRDWRNQSDNPAKEEKR